MKSSIKEDNMKIKYAQKKQKRQNNRDFFNLSGMKQSSIFILFAFCICRV